MTLFSERLYQSSRPIWERSHRHPFLTELRDGTLSPDRFIYYLKQDYVYLIDYAKLFALASVKSPDLETMHKFAELYHSTLHVEMELHRQYAERFGVPRAELERTKPAPTTIAYTKYMLDIATNGSLAQVVAALLPCMWSYREIGVTLAAIPGALEHPLFSEWILMYSSDEFGQLTDWCIDQINRLADGLPERELARLEEHFLTTSRLEYLFWDMAYRLEEWPV
ncbi:thiaminase II [Paenibacillus soyae]|uniref:Aminopyrimidine aminohydrolase n=1 Tax=Paenibacillus soyae TaxID=2969249 RepID=A0A9X2MND3_9BACL|nr:thiaminase II [Paenibacillus soyae]MCR2803861.1 thiaminase II [Paenibacillus soyae]